MMQKREISYKIVAQSLMIVVLYLLQTGKVFSQAPSVLFTLPATTYISETHPDSTFLHLKEEMQLHRQHQNKIGEAICLQKIGQLLYHLGNYAQAVEQLFAAEKILRQLQRPDLLGANLNILGTIYYYNQQPADAWNQFREALSIYKKTNNKAGIAETYGLIGHMYEKQLNYDSAYHYQLKAISFATASRDTTVMAKIHENIGSIYEDKARFDSARFYFQLALDEYHQLGIMVDQIEVINNLGDIWSKSGDFRKGQEFAKQAAAMALATGEKYQLQSAYRDMAQNFSGMRQFDSAYHYLEKSRHLIQSIYTIESGHQISLMQTLYDIEKKNNEIAQLNANGKITTTINIAVLAVLILLSLLAALVINRQKMKIKSEKAINESNKKVFETQKGLMESELKRQQLEETSLKQQLDIKSNELSSHILHLIQKNEAMEELKQGLSDIIKDDKRDQKKQIRQLQQKINVSFTRDSYWDDFRIIFDKVHPSFTTTVQQVCPTLTAGELRLMVLIKMNLASTDMAGLLGITPDSLRVTRYRVKKKLGLEQTESLTGFVQSL